MFQKSFQYYDKLYSFKDYAEEAEKIRSLILKERPGARTILDVACGTGEHARLLSQSFVVDGLDLEPAFVAAAQAKVPEGRFWTADMRSFSLGKTYDVVQCLFSSIGYLTRGEDVVKALQCFKAHLNPGGIVLVEPWITPEKWQTGIPWMVTVDEPELKICRMNVSDREGSLSKLRFHYLVTKKEGVEHFEEDHDLALYSVQEMLSFFESAGLAVAHDPEGIFGRGMYTARAKGGG